MNQEENAVINPIAGKKSPELGSVAVIAATRTDLNYLVDAFKLKKEDRKNFLVADLWESKDIVLAGPFTGGPHAALIIENLIVCGVKKIIFLGWCGAVSPDVKIGDIIIPDGAFSDEGTSRHYVDFKTDQLLKTSESLSTIVKQKLTLQEIPFHNGHIWSTDAIYRETKQKIMHYQDKGVLGVEMELAALIAVCLFRGVEIASVQVVSDEISSFVWNQGFGNKRFKQSRKIAAETIANLCMVGGLIKDRSL